MLIECLFLQYHLNFQTLNHGLLSQELCFELSCFLGKLLFIISIILQFLLQVLDLFPDQL